jgi:glycosyltransferase involved in cell wall biosynthesis
MPALNAAPYIGEAISSVLAQNWMNWELLVVDNGSTDQTASIVRRMSGDRVRLYSEAAKGVSHARNKALDLMKGDYFCFLDADDIMPVDSIRSRAEILLAQPQVHFADGVTVRMSPTMDRVIARHIPTFNGPPREALLRIDSSCFTGNTWMIRRSPTTEARFPTNMGHSEDIAYYLLISSAGTYAHTSSDVLFYRSGHGSAMSDLDGQYAGYRQLFSLARSLRPPPRQDQLDGLWARITSIMVRSYLRAGEPLKALRTLLRKRP